MALIQERGKSFGHRASEYVQARQPFPFDAAREFHQLLPNPAKVIDIGCGTGLSTEAIANASVFAVGCDTDSGMLAEAMKSNGVNVAYRRADAEYLPFLPGSFDGAAIVSAFHWFANAQAVAEIIRVLKPGGPLLVVNKFDEDNAKDRFRLFVKAISGFLVPDAKASFDPVGLLENSGFRIKTAYSTYYDETYDVRRLRSYLLSTSIGSFLPDSPVKSFEKEFDDFLYAIAGKGGRYIRSTRVATILALRST